MESEEAERALLQTLSKLRHVRKFPKNLNQWRQLKTLIARSAPESVVYTLANLVAFLHHEGYFLKQKLDVCIETLMFLINDEGDIHEKIMNREKEFMVRAIVLSERVQRCWEMTNLKKLPEDEDLVCAACTWYMNCTIEPSFKDTLRRMRYWDKKSEGKDGYVNDSMIRRHKLIVVRFANPFTVNKTLVEKMKFLQAQKYLEYLARGENRKYVFLEIGESFAKSINTIQFLHHLYKIENMQCAHDNNTSSPICGCYLALNTMHLSDTKNFPTIGQSDNDIIIEEGAYSDEEEEGVNSEDIFVDRKVRKRARDGMRLCHYMCMKTEFYNFISSYVLKLCCNPYVSRNGPLPLHPRIATLIIRGKPEDRVTGFECLYRMLFSIDTYRSSKRSVTGINFIISPSDPCIEQIGKLFCRLVNLWTKEEIQKEVDDSIDSMIERFKHVKADKTEHKIDLEEDTNVKRRCVSRKKTQFFTDNVSWEVSEKETERVSVEYRKKTVVRHYSSAKLVSPPTLLRAIHGFLEWNVDHYIEEYAFEMLKEIMADQPRLKEWNHELTLTLERMDKDRIKGEPVWIKRRILFIFYSFLCISSIPRDKAKDIFRGIYSSRDRERAINKMQLILGNLKFNSSGIQFHKKNGFFERYYNGDEDKRYVQEDVGTRRDSEVMRPVNDEDTEMVEKINYVVFLFERRRYAMKNLDDFPFTSIIPSLKMKNPQFPVLVLGKQRYTKRDTKKDCLVVHTNHLMPKIPTEIKVATHIIPQKGKHKHLDPMSNHYVPRFKTLDQNALADCMNIYTPCAVELNKLTREESQRKTVH